MLQRDRGQVSDQTRSGRYCRARYYHPGLQRFISEDPIGFEGGDTNLYAYVANAPLDFTDPSGTSLAPGAIPGYCRDHSFIPMTPGLSGRKGVIAQVFAAERAFLGLAWQAVSCSIVDTTGGLVSVTGKVAFSVQALLRDAVVNPGRWRTIAVHTEATTGRAVRGGTSVQEIVENVETGERLVWHSLFRRSGKLVDSHPRPTYKPRPGDLRE